MKKLLFGAAACLALTSCLNDEPATQSNRAITFDSPVMYGNEMTRANVYGEIGSHTQNGSTYTYPSAEEFIIYAVTHTTNFTGWEDATPAIFNNTAIAYDINVDGWAPKTTEGKYYFWEEGRMMSYAASSPADLEQAHWAGADKRTYDGEGLSIDDFHISGDASKQYDLLFSTRACNTTAANMNHNAQYYSGLTVKFQHALSSIRFSIANSSEESVHLTGITVSGVKYKGNFKENIVEDSTDPTIYNREVQGNVTPEWTVEDDLVTAPYVAFTGEIQFLEEPRYVSQLVAQVGDGTNVCNQLLLMPQELTDDATVTVNYKVNGTPNSKTIKLKGLESYKNVDNTDVATGTISSWEIGKRYTYRLYYSSATANRDKIYFSPSTDDWDDVDVIIVNL